MVNFYVYSFSIAAIPLLLGVLLIWFGKKLWKKANAENAKYRQHYSGRTTLRVIGVEKHEREERDSNESGEIIYVTSYTPIYEYMVNGQRYEYIHVWEARSISILSERNIRDIMIRRIRRM